MDEDDVPTDRVTYGRCVNHASTIQYTAGDLLGIQQSYYLRQAQFSPLQLLKR